MSTRAVLAWARLDLRRRWVSLAVLAVLVALATGTVVTAFAGARRGASALDRLERVTLPADAWILPNDPDFDWTPIRKLPEIEAIAGVAIFSTLGFEDGRIPSDATSYPAVDAAYGTTIEKPVVLEGRMYDPTAWDEAVVTQRFADNYDKKPGDTIPVVLGGPEQVYSDPLPVAELTGPHIRLRIVGVVRSLTAADSTEHASGRFLVSPALVAKYPDNILGRKDASASTRAPVNAMVRLRHGAADLERLQSDVGRITGRPDIGFLNLTERNRDFRRPIHFEATFLAAFGAAALLAAVFLIGQAVARHVFAQADDMVTARALGLTRAESVAGTALGPGIAGALGATLGAGGAVIASRWFPLGLAANYEPRPGVQIDVLVVVATVVGTVLLVVIGAASSGLVASRGRRLSTAHRSAVGTFTARLPLPVAMGTRFALERGVGTARVPVVPALAGAVAGTLGIVAVTVFGAAIADALDHPARFGQTYQASSVTGLYGEDYVEPADFASKMGTLPEVSSLTMARLANVTSGDASISLFEHGSGDRLRTVVTSGRMPHADDEVLLGPSRLRTMGLQVGDRIRFEGSRTPQSFRIVGAGFEPTGTVSRYADAGWVTTGGFDRLFKTFEFRYWFFVMKHPSDHSVDQLYAAAKHFYPDAVDSGLEITPPDIGGDVAMLHEVRLLPRALGGFLGLLAAGVIGHALVLAVRRRSGELGVARALGMTPRQARLTVSSCSVVIALVGLAFGIPLGLAAGRAIWRTIADFTPLAYAAPVPVGALGLVVLGILLVALLLSALPARMAARRSVAMILRAE